jgi:hypothetical protein
MGASPRRRSGLPLELAISDWHAVRQRRHRLPANWELWIVLWAFMGLLAESQEFSNWFLYWFVPPICIAILVAAVVFCGTMPARRRLEPSVPLITATLLTNSICGVATPLALLSLTNLSCRASTEKSWTGAGQILFEPECSGGDSAPGRSNGKKSPTLLFQTLFEKGGMQLRRPSANSGSHPKAQMKIAGTLNLVKGIARLGSRPAFMNAPFRCWTFLWFSGRRLTMLRPALDHNISGVLESLPSVGIKL